MEPILRVHDPGMLAYLETAWQEFAAEIPGRQLAMAEMYLHRALFEGMDIGRAPKLSGNGRIGFWCFDTSTPLVEGTWPAALSAVDVALTAADSVRAGDRFAYGLCRPPGHHAARSGYGGYCFLNNAAIAVQYLIDAGAAKVSIIDIDVHHGNGTQQIFWSRPEVQYISLHLDPDVLYPWFTGRADELGGAGAEGVNINVPLPPGTGGDGYLAELSRVLEAVEAHAPEFVVLSLGTDAAAGDPQGGLSLSTEDFGRIGRAIGSLAGPVLVIQEGGYQLDRIGADVRAVLEGLQEGR
jgi:acetoin utilization deacetylase AcuC-like enzyme